ncbi:MAG TPA: S46 family peptidase [Caulobacteraceae bacterium]|nr:S46 family peptidase [Caulobacteraceae bacterium]
MLRSVFVAAAVACLVLIAPPARANEGMWPFDEAPVAQVRAALGVKLDSRWLDHLRGASVRLTSGCSAAVVSPRGLILTSQHCIVDCAEALSSLERDYVADGFTSDGEAEEKTCPDVQAEILVGITDVTAAVFASSRGKYGAAFATAREDAIAAAERDACGGDRRFFCQAISFYEGGQFKVYKYRRYADVRLVFAPEFDAAFFGGDPDNFNFPRYDLDCAFLRLYEDGRPAATPDRLAWTTAPPLDGEPVFVSGDPGATERQLTVAQLQTLRDVALPLLQDEQSELKARLLRLGAESPEMARVTAAPLFDVENVLKIFAGRQATLHDPAFMAARAKADAALQARLAADPQLARQIGDPWSEIEAAQKAYARQFVVWRQLEVGAGGGSDLFRYARDLVRGAEERAKPSPQRLPEYADSRLPLVEKLLFDARSIDPKLERLYLQLWFSRTRALLGPDSPAVAMLMGAESPRALAARLVAGSTLADPQVRRRLWDGGAAAIAASPDPMVRFVVQTDPLARAARQVWEEEVYGPVEMASERIARARYALEGPGIYPDATFSPRLSYGKVAGWTYQDQETAPFTTFSGLFARATGAAPYRLPARWLAAAGKLDGAAVLDFSTTNDITGGNSGSPVVDAKGRIVGSVFDGNIHSIAGDFTYDGALDRTIAVSTQAITDALEHVYGDRPLVKELTGR